MLSRARSKVRDERVTFGLAAGEALPRDQATADLIFMSMVLHHLNDPVRVAEECHRILRPGGVVCLRNTTLDDVK